MKTNTLFLTLNIFSATGGIEKVCRIAGKALYEQAMAHNQSFMIWSMHDKDVDVTGNAYFPAEYYTSFAGNRASFVSRAVRQGILADTVILSHINMLMIAWTIKKISPRTKIILMAHGIEIWGKISFFKKIHIAAVDRFWAVSYFTKNRIIEQHHIPAKKIEVLNNCLDPYLPAPKNIFMPAGLRQRYRLGEDDKILFTLTRLSSKEKYKGYVDVLQALKELNDPTIKYILAGKADPMALAQIKQHIIALGLQQQVILAGFLPEEELAAHFTLSDCYIMPSSKEGFGIVFIEAMYYGIPVIGGNADGTADALQHGKLGCMVEPGNITAIKNTIQKVLAAKETYKPNTDLLNELFSYRAYKKKLEALSYIKHQPI
ncbi:MAG: glycosyltransferase family 4 protein [Niastella sp.]|nr:glycosyltransferase family 4 protein [Niastella sp.]